MTTYGLFPLLVRIILLYSGHCHHCLPHIATLEMFIFEDRMESRRIISYLRGAVRLVVIPCWKPLEMPPASATSPSRTSAFAATHSPSSNSNANSSTNDIMMAKALQSHRKKSQRAEEQMEKLKIKVDFLQTDKTLLLQQKKELLQRLKEQQITQEDGVGGGGGVERETSLSDRTNAMSPGSVESFSSAVSQQTGGDLRTEIGFLHERLLQAEQDKNAESVMLRNSKLIVETLQNELQVANENPARAKKQLEAQQAESAAGRSVTRLESENQSLVAQLGKLETDLWKQTWRKSKRSSRRRKKPA
jgi:hypothetical protein